MLRVLQYGNQVPWVRPPRSYRMAAYPHEPSDRVTGHSQVDNWVTSGLEWGLMTMRAGAAQDAALIVIIQRPKDFLVADLSRKNAYMADRRFGYESLPRFTSDLQPRDNSVSRNLFDAIFHELLSLSDQRLLASRVGRRVLAPVVLPLGMVMPPVVAALRRRCSRLTAYHDDCVPSTLDGEALSSSAGTRAARVVVLALFASFGLTVHPRKRALGGTTTLRLLGLDFVSAVTAGRGDNRRVRPLVRSIGGLPMRPIQGAAAFHRQINIVRAGIACHVDFTRYRLCGGWLRSHPSHHISPDRRARGPPEVPL